MINLVVFGKMSEFLVFFLNMSVSLSLLRSSGKLFHSLGPCMLKEHSANVLHIGTTSKFVFDADLRPGLPDLWTANIFWRYSGAFPMMDLWTRVSIL